MLKVLMNGYTIRIKERNTKNYKILRNFDGNSSNFADILYNFLNTNIGVSSIKRVKDQKTIYYGDLGHYNQDKEIIKCKAYVGVYGNRYDVVNYNTKLVDYNIKTDDSYAFPLNFMVYVPQLNTNTKIPDTGILVFEKFKNHGGKGLFVEQLEQYFTSNVQFKNYIIEINPFIPREIINIMKKGVISSVTIKGSSVSSDIAENISIRKKSKVELKFSKASITSTFRNRIVELLEKGKHVNFREVLDGPIIDPREISFDTDYNGQKRKVVLKDEGELMTPGIDVTDYVKPFTSDGYPDDTKLYERENIYIEQIKQSYNNGT